MKEQKLAHLEEIFNLLHLPVAWQAIIINFLGGHRIVLNSRKK